MHHRKGILAIIISLALALLPLSIASADSTVTVGIEAPAEVHPGSSFVANVTVDAVADLDSCGFDVTYDEAVIHVTDVTGGVIGGYNITVDPGGWSYIPAGSVDRGRIRVTAVKSGAPAPGVTGTGHLAQIHFEVIGSGGTASNITLDRVGMYDWQANLIRTATEGHSVQVSQPTEPTIAFGPNVLTFPASASGADPASQTLEIWNSGPGTLDWSMSDDAAWLTLAPTSGSSTGEKDKVTVSVDIAGMGAGVYSATTTITAAGATNTPRTLAVTLTVTETEAPAIAVDPASLSFSAVAGQANPADKTLEIWNSGTGTLNWSVSDDAAWLSLTPTSGSSTGDQDVVTIAASVDISGLTAGSYPATITITAAGATNTPRTAGVTLQISEGANGTAKSVATATGTGTALFVSNQGSIEQLASIDEASLPEEGKPGLEFPQGFFSFSIVGIAPGDEVEVQITLPDSVPPDAEYWAYYDNEWRQVPMAMDSDDDRVITITLVDGGLGDGDGMADGAITDPGGPGYPLPVDGGAHHLSKGAIAGISIAGAAIIAGAVLLVRRRRSTLV